MCLLFEDIQHSLMFFFPLTGHHSKDENVLFGKIGIYGGLLCVGREMEYRGFSFIGDEHAHGY